MPVDIYEVVRGLERDSPALHGSVVVHRPVVERPACGIVVDGLEGFLVHLERLRVFEYLAEIVFVRLPAVTDCCRLAGKENELCKQDK